MRIMENSKKPAMGGGRTKICSPWISMSSNIPLDARASRIFCDSAAGFFQILAAAAMLKGLMGSRATRAASSRVKSTSRMRKSSSEGGAPCGNRLSRSVSDW